MPHFWTAKLKQASWNISAIFASSLTSTTVNRRSPTVLLEYTGTVATRDLSKQMLDDMDLEQEARITIKLHAIQIKYQARNKKELYIKSHRHAGPCGFHYEVSRSLAACEGAILVVDATQGVEAQTISNLYLLSTRTWNYSVHPIRSICQAQRRWSTWWRNR